MFSPIILSTLQNSQRDPSIVGGKIAEQEITSTTDLRIQNNAIVLITDKTKSTPIGLDYPAYRDYLDPDYVGFPDDLFPLPPPPPDPDCFDASPGSPPIPPPVPQSRTTLSISPLSITHAQYYDSRQSLQLLWENTLQSDLDQQFPPIYGGYQPEIDKIIDSNDDITVLTSSHISFRSLPNPNNNSDEVNIPTEFIILASSTGSVKQLVIINQTIPVSDDQFRQSVDIYYGNGKIIDDEILVPYTILSSLCNDTETNIVEKYGILAIDINGDTSNNYLMEMVVDEDLHFLNQKVRIAEIFHDSQRGTTEISFLFFKLVPTLFGQTATAIDDNAVILITQRYNYDVGRHNISKIVGKTGRSGLCETNCRGWTESQDKIVLIHHRELELARNSYTIESYADQKTQNTWNFSLTDSILSPVWFPTHSSDNWILLSGTRSQPGIYTRPILVLAEDWAEHTDHSNTPIIIEFGKSISSEELSDSSAQIIAIIPLGDHSYKVLTSQTIGEVTNLFLYTLDIELPLIKTQMNFILAYVVPALVILSLTTILIKPLWSKKRIILNKTGESYPEY